MIQKFIEIPNTPIGKQSLTDHSYDVLYDMAQQYGHAQLVWYSLNGTRVLEVHFK